MRVRTHELFQDFDKLRSGFMTSSQFRRCVSSVLDRGVIAQLNEDELKVLVAHYEAEHDGLVKWTVFVDKMDKGLNY